MATPPGFAWAALAAALALGAAAQDPELDALCRLMPGRYDTLAQAEADDAAGTPYRHDRAGLAIAAVPTPSGAPEGRWFYVENTLLSAPDKPYRQRLYRISRRDDALVVEVYKLADAAPLAGAVADPARLRGLEAAALQHEAGCDVALRRDGELWRGRTLERSCRSSWRGGSFVTSEVTIAPAYHVTLDRGYDEAGQQKWGPPDGRGYEFRRRSESAQQRPN